MNGSKLQNVLKKLFSWGMYPFWIFLTALFLSLSIAIYSEVPMVDLNRYCPMADAFRAGCWENAFHPRISPLTPCLGGICVLLTGLDAFSALKLVSSLAFALTVFPLYGIFRRFLDPVPARIGILMAAFASMSLRYASSGMRDSTKGLLFILCVFLLLRIFDDKRRLRNYLYLGAAGALLALTRTECPVYTGMFLLAAFAIELFHGKRLFPLRSLLAVLATVAVMTPWLCYMNRTIGYPVPQVRYAYFMEKLAGNTYQKVEIVQPDTPVQAQAPAIPSAKPSASAPAVSSNAKKLLQTFQNNKAYERNNNNDGLYERFIVGILDGFYPVFGGFALLGILLRLYRRKWSAAESIVCASLLLHMLLLILQIRIADHVFYISRRYLLPVTPLEFGWSAYGAWAIYEFLSARTRVVRHPVFLTLLFLLPALGLYWHGFYRIIKSYRSHTKSVEREALLRISKKIRKDYKGPRYFEHAAFDKEVYRPNLRPTVFSYWEQLGILSGGRTLYPEDPDWQMGEIQPDYIVVRRNDVSPDTMEAAGYVRIRTYMIRKIPFHLYKCKGI